MLNFNGMGQSQQVNISQENLDLFIDRCKNEKGYDLSILNNEILGHLQRGGMFKLGEFEVYERILQRIKQRYDAGEDKK